MAFVYDTLGVSVCVTRVHGGRELTSDFYGQPSCRARWISRSYFSRL
ncbi:hypothetical protein HSB1_33000 [Halogranum salarium B-1]|uniref:Uncharacterized protein n=1 Tax=Halogranum salarium B-1 TaxID=1210908 RepID=J2ZXY1_9EURY|nr:hypothetical protein HSB1_33000 [Halogranum salarium B-1]